MTKALEQRPEGSEGTSPVTGSSAGENLLGAAGRETGASPGEPRRHDKDLGFSVSPETPGESRTAGSLDSGWGGSACEDAKAEAEQQ